MSDNTAVSVNVVQLPVLVIYIAPFLSYNSNELASSTGTLDSGLVLAEAYLAKSPISSGLTFVSHT